MSPEQIELVRSTFTTLSRYPLGVGLMFYQRLFSANTHLRSHFKGEIADQARALVEMMGRIVETLDQPDKLYPCVYAMGWRHARHGIPADHFEAFGEALVSTVTDAVVVPPSFGLREAWEASYAVVAGIMKTAAEDAAAGRPPRYAIERPAAFPPRDFRS